MTAYGEDVYCTLLMNDAYLPGNVTDSLVSGSEVLIRSQGASVLAHSLRDARTKKKLAVMVTLDSVSPDTVTELRNLYDYVIPVDRISNPRPANLYLMGRPDLAFAFTKIALWQQTRFRKIVYIDADVVCLRAPDELFDIPASFAAAPDVGWPDCFNTGVMVLSPDVGEYRALRNLAESGDSFDGADQGLLNQYYENQDWHRLSFTYNCTPNAQYQWEPAYRYHKSRISMVHFIGRDKPWTKGRHFQGSMGVYNELLARWWAVYDRHYRAPAATQISGQYYSHDARPVSTTTTTAGPGPQPAPGSSSNPPAPSIVVQQYVAGEQATSGDYGYSSAQNYGAQDRQPQPQPHQTSTEVPMTEPDERAQNTEQTTAEPAPTVQERRFSAPHMAWDATREAPPTQSHPEASNFPTQTYEFNRTQDLFQPPAHYPEPPKNMWYEVPESKPEPRAPPKPIFPWEVNQAPPTRRFADEPRSPEPQPQREPEPQSQPEPAVPERQPEQQPQQPPPPPPPRQPSPPPKPIFPWEANQAPPTRVWRDEPSQFSPPPLFKQEPDSEPPKPASVPETHHDHQEEAASGPGISTRDFAPANETPGLEERTQPETSLSRLVAPRASPPLTTWEAFSQSRNVWDSMPSIEAHVGKLRRKLLPKEAAREEMLAASPFSPAGHGRRGSLILTDFPSEDERPSLPVTPAPRRRQTFWGTDDGTGTSELPGAEGVPDQADFDPLQSLEQLRRASLLSAAELKLPSSPSAGRKIPQRELPTSSADIRQPQPQRPLIATGASGGASPHGLNLSEYFASETEDLKASGTATSDSIAGAEVGQDGTAASAESLRESGSPSIQEDAPLSKMDFNVPDFDQPTGMPTGKEEESILSPTER